MTAEFAAGLQLNRLHPPHIITFLQGLPRRLDQRMVEHVATSPQPAAGPEVALDAIADTLSRSIDEVKAVGYALDDAIREFWSPAVDTDPELSRIAAAALELARWIAGVPDSDWTTNPDLLDRLRTDVATIAEHLDSIGDDGELGDDDYRDEPPVGEPTDP